MDITGRSHPEEFRVYFTGADVGAFQKEPGGEIYFVWDGVTIAWQDFLKRVHALKVAVELVAAVPCKCEGGYCEHEMCRRAVKACLPSDSIKERP